MALDEETATDHRFGRFMTHNLADYHLPVNADVGAIDVIFVEEKEDEINPRVSDADSTAKDPPSGRLGDTSLAVFAVCPNSCRCRAFSFSNARPRQVGRNDRHVSHALQERLPETDKAWLRSAH